MSCNGCRVLRKGCSDSCTLRPCLQWIEGAEAQGNATVFVAKFFGRAGLMNFINAVPENQRPALFRSLLYEACGRTVNPVYGAIGLLWSGNWQICQSAVDTVLRGGSLKTSSSSSVAAPSLPCYGPMPNLPRIHLSSQHHQQQHPAAAVAADEDLKRVRQMDSKASLQHVEVYSPAIDLKPSIEIPYAHRQPHDLVPCVKRERTDECSAIVAPVARRAKVMLKGDDDDDDDEMQRGNQRLEIDLDLDLTLGTSLALPMHPPTPQLPQQHEEQQLQRKKNKNKKKMMMMMMMTSSPSSCSSEGSVTSVDTADVATDMAVATADVSNGDAMDLLKKMDNSFITNFSNAMS